MSYQRYFPMKTLHVCITGHCFLTRILVLSWYLSSALLVYDKKKNTISYCYYLHLVNVSIVPGTGSE